MVHFVLPRLRCTRFFYSTSVPRMIAMCSDIGTVTILQQIHVSTLMVIELKDLRDNLENMDRINSFSNSIWRIEKFFCDRATLLVVSH